MKMHNNKTPCEFQNQDYLRKFVATGQLVETIEEKHVLVIDLSKALPLSPNLQTGRENWHISLLICPFIFFK